MRIALIPQFLSASDPLCFPQPTGIASPASLRSTQPRVRTQLVQNFLFLAILRNSRRRALTCDARGDLG